jgi:hypothetical protein
VLFVVIPLVLFGVVSWATVVYMRSNNQTSKNEIDDPSAKNPVDDSSDASNLASSANAQSDSTTSVDSTEVVQPNTQSPPESATTSDELTLFDGTDLSSWAVDPDTSKAFTVNNGVLACSGDPSGVLWTKDNFRDFELSLEYRFLPGKRVSGQGSGIIVRTDRDRQLRDLIEVQLKPPSSGGDASGAVWLRPEAEFASGRTSSRLPLLRPRSSAAVDRSIETWNEITIRCVGSEIQVTLNDRVVNSGRTASRFAAPIGLRSQGTAIEFRNITLTDLEKTNENLTQRPLTDQANVVTPSTSARDLFNGKDLSGWSARNEDSTGTRSSGRWSADEGRQAITCTGTGRDYLVSDESFDEYVFELEWMFKPGGPSTPNGSGVVIHSTGNPFENNPRGYEIDLRIPATSGGKPVSSGRIRAGTGAVICYGVTAANHTGPAEGTRGSVRGLGALRPPEIDESGGWNRLRIATFDDRFLVWINDDLVNEVWNLSETFGRICLRSQKTAVEFRRVSIRSVTEGGERVSLQLDGKWRAVRQEIGGNQWSYQKLFEHKKFIRFSDDQFTINYLSQTSGRLVTETGHSSIEGNNIDLFLSGRLTGLEFQGVYGLKNGILRHCFVKCPDGKSPFERPQSVVTQGGMPQFGTTYIRWRSDERTPPIHPTRFVGRWTQTPTYGNSADKPHRVYDLLPDGSMLHTNLVTGEQVVGRWYYEDNAVWLDHDQGSKQYDIQSTAADVIQVLADGLRPYRWDRQDD